MGDFSQAILTIYMMIVFYKRIRLHGLSGLVRFTGYERLKYMVGVDFGASELVVQDQVQFWVPFMAHGR